MRFFVGVTDESWYRFLAKQQPPVPEVNFWRPSAAPFGALEPGCPFLFKLKAPINKIVGVGFFHSYRKLPVRMAWEAFTLGNGRTSYEDLRSAIKLFARKDVSGLTEIGCILLENPVFFDEPDWIEMPSDWSANIVSRKGYDTEERIGAHLWSRVQSLFQADVGTTAAIRPSATIPTVFGKAYLQKSRPGQGGFRLSLLDAYSRRCAITGESTMPVLEAAHILPVSSQGTNHVTNGLLLSSDMHILFDDGLIGVTPDYEIQISDQIRELYVNGKVYYRWHGEKLTNLPVENTLRPDRDKLDWHMNHVFVK